MLKELYEFKDVYHIIEKWKPETIKQLFFLLLREKKVSFKELSESYVEALEVDNTDKLKQLIEAETCVLEHMISAQHRTKKDDKEKTYQRSLYFLNKSNRFNMEEINKHFDYDENKAKEFSCYERAKKIKEENDWFND